MDALKLKLKVPPALCLLLLLMPPLLLLSPGCAAIRSDPTQGPSEGNRTCTELSKRNPILYCEEHACADNCHIEGFIKGGECNWLRCLCNKPC
ncbi:hypothetical protein D1007_36293 [Hordeum vulgare]|nr:hypothetical protein D1007_36293 [Hordeum vulgare]